MRKSDRVDRHSNHVSDRNGNTRDCTCFRSTCESCAPYDSQKPSINLEPIKKKEKQKMSDQQRESVTFNDIFMFMIAVPLVLLWVGFAGYVIWHGLRDPTVLTQIEGYTTLIAILGGPALLIIKDALDVWKQEQAEKTAFYKIKAQAVIDYNDSMQKQAQMIEAKQQEQEHKMENKK